MSFDFGGSGGSGWDDGTPAQPTSSSPPQEAGTSSWDAATTGGAVIGTLDVGSPTSAPLLWLGGAALAAVASIAAHLSLDGFVAALGGWLVGGFLAAGLLGVFLKQDTAARANPFYAKTAVAEWGRRAVVVVILVAVALNAWAMADVISRGGI